MSEFFSNSANLKYLAIGLFVLMYVLLVLLPKRRAIVALSTATLMIILQILPLSKVPGHFLFAVLVAEIHFLSADYGRKLRKIVRNGPVEGHVCEG